jgi:hypothetical protein
MNPVHLEELCQEFTTYVRTKDCDLDELAAKLTTYRVRFS